MSQKSCTWTELDSTVIIQWFRCNIIPSTESQSIVGTVFGAQTIVFLVKQLTRSFPSNNKEKARQVLHNFLKTLLFSWSVSKIPTQKHPNEKRLNERMVTVVSN